MQLSIFLRYKEMAVGKTTAFYLQLFLSEVLRRKTEVLPVCVCH